MIQVGADTIIKDNKVLLAKRKQGKSLVGMTMQGSKQSIVLTMNG